MFLFAFYKKLTDQTWTGTNENPPGTHPGSTRNQPKSPKNRPGNEQSITPIFYSAWFVMDSFTPALEFLFLLTLWESKR